MITLELTEREWAFWYGLFTEEETFEDYADDHALVTILRKLKQAKERASEK